MPTFTSIDCPKDIECAICLEPWLEPVELLPCKHVFCKGCIAAVNSCPECRNDITGRAAPHRILINLAADVMFCCSDCGWKGKRGETAAHRCGAGGSPAGTRTPPPVGAAPGAGANMPPAAGNNQWAGNLPRPGPSQQQQQHQQVVVPQPQPQPNFGRQEQPMWGIPPQSGGSPQGVSGGGGYGTGYNANTTYGSNNAYNNSYNSGAGGGGVGGGGRRMEVIPVAKGGDRPWVQYGLSQVEFDQIFSIFLHFDTDGSGNLGKQELKRLAKWLNFAHSDRDVDTMFQLMDTDKSGTLSIDEFCTWLSHNKPDPTALYGMPQSEYNYVLMQFHQFDTNSVGELNEQQFVDLAMSCGYARSRDEAIAIFRGVDQNRSGRVDLHEFLTFRSQQFLRPSGPTGQSPYNAMGGNMNTGFGSPTGNMNTGGSAMGGGGGGGYPAQGSPMGGGGYNTSPMQPQPAPQKAPMIPAQLYSTAPVMAPQPPAPPQQVHWRGPPGWEKAVAPDGRPYYIDHNSKATHWMPPMGYAP